MSSPPTTYLCYPKPDTRPLDTGGCLVGFERHEDTIAYWTLPWYEQKAWFASDSYWEQEHYKKAFLAKYPKSPPHPARANPTHEFFREYEKFIAVLACIQGVLLWRTRLHENTEAESADAAAAAIETQNAMDAFLTDRFLSAWTDLPAAAVKQMGTRVRGLTAFSWIEDSDHAVNGVKVLGSWGADTDNQMASGAGWGSSGWEDTVDDSAWGGGGWGTDTVDDSVWGGGGWGTGTWGQTWAPGWFSKGLRPQSSRRYASNGRSMGAFFRPCSRRSRRSRKHRSKNAARSS